MTVTTNDFKVAVTEAGQGYNKPQQMGRRLWAPMWLMAVVAFPVAFIVALVAYGQTDPVRLEVLRNLGTGIMFIGFASVFGAVVFAIARIMGAFRKGGGEVQETVGVRVQTLRMPATARGMMVTMALAMMAVLAASILHFVVAANLAGGAFSLATGERWFVVLEGVRRLGVAVYLTSIALGLATIVTVLRFQATRLRRLPSEARGR